MKQNLLLILILLMSICTGAYASDNYPVGQVKTAIGTAHVIRGSERIKAEPGTKIFKSEALETGKQGSMGAVFNNNSTLSLGPETRFVLSRYEFNVLEKRAGFVGQIRRGTMVYLSGLIAKLNAGATRFETPAAVAGIKGTKLAIKVDGGDNE